MKGLGKHVANPSINRENWRSLDFYPHQSMTFRKSPVSNKISFILSEERMGEWNGGENEGIGRRGRIGKWDWYIK